MNTEHSAIALRLQNDLIGRGFSNFVGLGKAEGVEGAVIYVYLNGKRAKSDAKTLIDLEGSGFEGLAVRLRATGPLRIGG